MNQELYSELDPDFKKQLEENFKPVFYDLKDAKKAFGALGKMVVLEKRKKPVIKRAN